MKKSINTNKTRKKVFIQFLIGLFLMIFMRNSVSVYANDNEERIIVSMGDSYSSGEGIKPYFGQDEPIAQKVNNPDWLSHRSQKAWSGMLSLPGVDGVMSNKRNKNWFFVAESGAKTENIHYNFLKEYDKSGYKGVFYLEPQIDIFDTIGQNKVDYVTITLGGNDIDFAGIVSQCVFGENDNPNKLIDKFNNIWSNFFSKGGVRDKLYDTYYDISQKAGSQAKIIVAGYPKLFDAKSIQSMGITLISSYETDIVNQNVSKFNRAIEDIVTECQENGMKIYFVSVEDEFEGHGAYSKTDEYIKGIYVPSDSEDLKFGPFSLSSVHPNEKGARAYAECVQLKIDELEGLTSNAKEYNPETKLAVYDENKNFYNDYDITIVGKRYDENKKNDYAKKIFVNQTKEIELNLPVGDYTITVQDHKNNKLSYEKKISIRTNAKYKTLNFMTNFGQSDSEEKSINLDNETLTTISENDEVIQNSEVKSENSKTGLIGGLSTLIGFIVILGFLFGIMSNLAGDHNKGSQILINCVSVLILYFIVVEMFNVGTSKEGIFQTGIPLINNVKQAGSLKALIHEHTAEFALDFVELVTLTVIINWISNILQFEKSGLVGSITSRIIIVLLGIVIYGFFMDFVGNNIVFKWCVYAVECILTGGSILYTPAMIVAAITGFKHDSQVVTYFLLEFKKTNFARAIANAISSSVVFLGFLLLLENQYGSICNVFSGTGVLIYYIGVVVIIVMGIYFAIRSVI